jgi:hypothetical protein
MARCRQDRRLFYRIKLGVSSLIILAGCSEATGSANLGEPKTKAAASAKRSVMQEAKKQGDFIVALCSILKKSNAEIRKDLSSYPARQTPGQNGQPATETYRLDTGEDSNFSVLSIIFGDGTGALGLLPNGLRATLTPKDGHSIPLSALEAQFGSAKMLPSRPILIQPGQSASPQDPVYSFNTPYPGDNQPICRVTAEYSTDASKPEAVLKAIVFNADYRPN